MSRPRFDSAAYSAAAIIYKSGPQAAAQLIGQINFGEKPGNRLGKLESAAASGWLVEMAGTFSLSDEARAYFDSIEKPAAKFVGVAAGPREPLTPLYSRPELSAKYKTDSSGSAVRDIDARFQRPEGHHFFTVSSGVA